MNLFQRYTFGQVRGPFLATMGALTGLAVLTQSLSNIDLVAEDGGTALALFQITLLATPQVMALLMPIAVFLACAIAMNRMISDSELTVGAAAGLSRRERLSPFLRLAIYAVIINLAVNLFVQPASFRQMREVLYEIRTDVVANFMREGEFVRLGENVTFYTREIGDNGVMYDVFIEDGSEDLAVAYSAQRGVVVRADSGPVMLLENGVRTWLDEQGAQTAVTFDSTEFDLSVFIDSSASFTFKESDKYLPELLDPSASEIARARSREDLYAEGHYRLSAPLYNLAFALLAMAAFMAVEHRRTGYTRFIIMAGAAALILRLAGFALQAAAASDSALNPLQYGLPIGGCVAALYLIVRPGLKQRVIRRFRPQRVSP
ncbi:LptF/LptG family permease [Maricaulaceae bacterium MS644]